MDDAQALLEQAAGTGDEDDARTAYEAAKAEYERMLAIQDAVADDPELKLGFAVYSRNCVGCHGIYGDGAGPAAMRLKVKPPPCSKGCRASAWICVCQALSVRLPVALLES